MGNKLFGSADTKIKSVDFTKSKIETFTEYAFANCIELQKITFGESCKELKSDILNNCINLKQIIFESETAPTIEKQDASMMKNIIIEVPEGKEKDYQTALDVNNPGATVTAEEDILRYTSTESIKKQGVPWITENYAKWSETKIPGEIIGKELYARFSWSGEYKGESVSGTFDAKIEKNGYSGGFSDMTGREVFPSVGKDDELLVYADKEQSSIMFTIRPYSELSENTEYKDNNFTYSFINVEKSIYGKSTYEGVVVLKDEITNVGEDAFKAIAFLTAIKLPKQINKIGNSAFMSCTSLTSIDLPSSLTSIGDYAFENCSNLSSIELPSGLTTIGNSAFNSCSSLTSIDLPSGLTTIGNSAFTKCEGLTSIDLPSSVETINYNAFGNCYSVTSVICRATTPPTLETDKDNYWFGGIKTDTCQVPSESISVYEAAANWSSQFKKFVAIQ